MIVSIVTVVYNDVFGIKKTIDSFIELVFNLSDLKVKPNIEWLIIDGESNDGTSDVILEYMRSILDTKSDFYEVKYLCEKDHGIYDAMNKGVLLSSKFSSYILFLNSGDFFLEKSYLCFVKLLRFNATVVSFKVVSTLNGDFIVTRRMKSLSDLRLYPCIPHQGAFIKTEYHKSNLYDVSYKILADYDFFCNTFNKGINFNLLDDEISCFIQGGVSNDANKSFIFLKELFSIQHKYFNSRNYIIIFSILIKFIIRRVPFFSNIEKFIRVLFIKNTLR